MWVQLGLVARSGSVSVIWLGRDGWADESTGSWCSLGAGGMAERVVVEAAGFAGSRV